MIYPRNKSKYRLRLLTLTIILHWSSIDCSVVNTKYIEYETPVCDAEDRIKNACFVQVPASTSLQCFLKCASSISCGGVLIFSPTLTCYHKTVCSFLPTCTIYDPNFKLYMNEDDLIVTTIPPETTLAVETTVVSETTVVPETTVASVHTTVPEGCLHGGIEDSGTGACDCAATGGYVGTKCERLASQCSELKSNGYSRGTYSVNLDLYGDGSFFFQTYCILSYFSNDFDIMRNSGSFDTTLTWNDYVNGFHLGPNDYFLGLEHLHRYTSSGGPHSITTTVVFESSDVSGSAGKSYGNFLVSSSSSGYSYTISGLTGTSSSISSSGGSTAGFGLDDCLSSQENTPFSSADNDQDGSSSNCAELAQSGWWFKGCVPFQMNPFGWNYVAKPGFPTDSHFHVPGYDTSRSSVRNAFKYFSLSLEL
ncbi:tenascin-n [Plakobranchus ocellatus]|uniref:Tenascin-n n=1 Tax=Plakobranchus ocellatus TaxID=259542 RepID=A0AAV4CM51_9GAST|nr:tenascin-n [Plakobranchus ocellatus]